MSLNSLTSSPYISRLDERSPGEVRGVSPHPRPGPPWPRRVWRGRVPPVAGLAVGDVAQPALELRGDQVVGVAQHARQARPPRPGDRASLLNLTIHLIWTIYLCKFLKTLTSLLMICFRAKCTNVIWIVLLLIPYTQPLLTGLIMIRARETQDTESGLASPEKDS